MQTRTTVTLDADTAELVRRHMAVRGVAFKEAVNVAIPIGLAGGERVPFTTDTADMGVPTVPLDAALRRAADIEGEDLFRKTRVGK